MTQKPKNGPQYATNVMWPQGSEFAGSTLFGRQWRLHVARLLKVDRKTINKWMIKGAPRWIAAHLEKVTYDRYDERAAKRPIKLDDPELGKLTTCADMLYSERCQYRKSKGLPPPPLTERPKQVRNPKFPSKRR